RSKLLDDLPPRLAAHENAAAWPVVANAGANALGAPALVGGQVGEIRTMPLARVDDLVAFRPGRIEKRSDRFDRRAGQGKVVAHRVDIAARAAEVGLHVDDDDGGVLRPPIAVVGPGIGVGGEGRQWGLRHLAIDSSPGMSRAECLALEVAIMMARVRM